jgi:hypothetical protein
MKYAVFIAHPTRPHILICNYSQRQQHYPIQYLPQPQKPPLSTIDIQWQLQQEMTPQEQGATKATTATSCASRILYFPSKDHHNTGLGLGIMWNPTQGSAKGVTWL